jgi:curli biogenesis system outer membrane secretion channel CsgG
MATTTQTVSSRASRREWRILFIVLLFAGLLTGCSSQPFGGYGSSPTAVREAGLQVRPDDQKRLVVLGKFSDGSRSPLSNYYDVGKGMTDALARALVNHSRFDVWVYPQLVQEVEEYIVSPREQQVRGLASMAQKYPDVSFVVTGRVTDFYHTNELAPEARRQGFFGGINEAIVAIQLTIVDLPQNRVVVSEHVFGTASTGKNKTLKLYDGISFGSVLFWNTPLGKASKEAIQLSMDKLNRVVPTLDSDPVTQMPNLRIVEYVSPEDIRVAGAAHQMIRRGMEFYVYPYDLRDKQHLDDPLIDPATGLPVRVEVVSSNRMSVRAKINGTVPAGVDLASAALRAVPTEDAELVLGRRINEREVQVEGWHLDPPPVDAEYYVFAPDLLTGSLVMVHDAHTQSPLRARIIRSDRSNTLAWLRGTVPVEKSLQGAVLRPVHLVHRMSAQAIADATPEPPGEDEAGQ